MLIDTMGETQFKWELCMYIINYTFVHQLNCKLGFHDTQFLRQRFVSLFEASERGIILLASDRGITILSASERGITILSASEKGITILSAPQRGITILPASKRGINTLQISILEYAIINHLVLYQSLYKNNSSICWEKGGHRTRAITYEILAPYINNSLLQVMNYSDSTFYFIDHVNVNDLQQYMDVCYLVIDIPLGIIMPFLPLVIGSRIAALHGMRVS